MGARQLAASARHGKLRAKFLDVIGEQGRARSKFPQRDRQLRPEFHRGRDYRREPGSVWVGRTGVIGVGESGLNTRAALQVYPSSGVCSSGKGSASNFVGCEFLNFRTTSGLLTLLYNSFPLLTRSEERYGGYKDSITKSER